MLSNLINDWSENITVLIASAPDTKYNNCTYTSTSISGRLIITTFQEQDDKGQIVICSGKLYSTNGSITKNSKIGNYKVFSVKECKNRQNEIEFYKYILI